MLLFVSLYSVFSTIFLLYFSVLMKLALESMRSEKNKSDDETFADIEKEPYYKCGRHLQSFNEI